MPIDRPSPDEAPAATTAATPTGATSTTATGAPRAGGAGTLAATTVSRIGFGAMQLERLHGDRDAAVTLVRRAVKLGVDHVDTAQFYGDGFVNSVLAEALTPRDGVVVVSKIGADPNPEGPLPLRAAQRPAQLRASVQDNLRTLGMEQIPVVNLRRLDHGPGLRPEGDQVVDLDDQLEVMVAMREEGLIGAIGVSSLTLDGVRRSLGAGITCVQNAYSLVAREDEAILALCAEHDIAWVPYFPLGGAFPGLPKVGEEPAVQSVAQSLGVSTAQVGLAWLLTHEVHVLLIPGTADAEHLTANVAAGSIALDEAAMASLDAVESRSVQVPIR